MNFRFILKLIILSSLILSPYKTMLEAGVLETKIREHVRVLAAEIGERNFFHYQNLQKAADYIKKELAGFGYSVEEQVYYLEKRPYRNIIATKPGTHKKDKIIIVCSHYDSVWGSPGGDDNASAVAGLLELARLVSEDNLNPVRNTMQKDNNTIVSNGVNKTIKFIATTNEEPPFYTTNDMGSLKYAQEAKRRGEDIETVLCLESIGFYSDNKRSQSYPLGFGLFYPDKANFIAVVGNLSSHQLLKRIVKEFKKASNFPVECLVAPIFLAPAISFSDHWSFWRLGYKAVMITDTAFYRNPYYHTSEDTPDKINYQKLSSVVEGLYKVLLKLAE